MKKIRNNTKKIYFMYDRIKRELTGACVNKREKVFIDLVHKNLLADVESRPLLEEERMKNAEDCLRTLLTK